MTWEITKDPRIKRRGDTYYARFSKRGIRVEDSLYTTNYNIAVDLVNKIERAILNNEDYKVVLGGKSENKTDLIEDLWPRFLEDKAKGNPKKKINKVRDNTLKGYIAHWKYFEKFWANKSLDEITEDEWEAYILYAREKSERGDSLKLFNHWKVFSSFCSWAIAIGKIDKMPNIYDPDPTTFLEELEDEDGVGINITDSQAIALKDHSYDNNPFELYVYCALFMGMRSSEITQMKKDRLDFEAGLIKLRVSDTKTKEARSIPIHPMVMLYLKAQVETFPDSPYLFPNRIDSSRPMDPTGFKKPWNALRTKHGLECRFHDLRHSYATRVFANPNINPVVACKALGMSMKTAMKHYIHFSETQLSTLNSFKLEVSK